MTPFFIYFFVVFQIFYLQMKPHLSHRSPVLYSIYRLEVFYLYKLLNTWLYRYELLKLYYHFHFLLQAYLRRFGPFKAFFKRFSTVLIKGRNIIASLFVFKWIQFFNLTKRFIFPNTHIYLSQISIYKIRYI